MGLRRYGAEKRIPCLEPDLDDRDATTCQLIKEVSAGIAAEAAVSAVAMSAAAKSSAKALRSGAWSVALSGADTAGRIVARASEPREENSNTEKRGIAHSGLLSPSKSSPAPPPQTSSPATPPSPPSPPPPPPQRRSASDLLIEMRQTLLEEREALAAARQERAKAIAEAAESFARAQLRTLAPPYFLGSEAMHAFARAGGRARPATSKETFQSSAQMFLTLSLDLFEQIGAANDELHLRLEHAHKSLRQLAAREAALEQQISSASSSASHSLDLIRRSLELVTP